VLIERSSVHLDVHAPSVVSARLTGRPRRCTPLDSARPWARWWPGWAGCPDPVRWCLRPGRPGSTWPRSWPPRRWTPVSRAVEAAAARRGTGSTPMPGRTTPGPSVAPEGDHPSGSPPIGHRPGVVPPARTLRGDLVQPRHRLPQTAAGALGLDRGPRLAACPGSGVALGDSSGSPFDADDEAMPPTACARHRLEASIGAMAPAAGSLRR
jgi:hypothetical protein